MLAIILSACLSNDPGVCRDYKIPVNGGEDPMLCALWAPPHFAQWAQEHPGWTIKRWKCTAASHEDI